MRSVFVRPTVVAWSAAAIVVALTAGSTPAQLTGTLTDGNARFTQGTTTAGFRPEGNAGPDHLYAQWMYYRVDGDTHERPFGNGTWADGVTTTLSGVYAGNTATYTLRDSNSSGARFKATWTITLTDDLLVHGKASLKHTVTITNPITGTPLNISLFHYSDYDVNNTDSWDSVTGGLNGFTQADGWTSVNHTLGTPASAYQAAPFMVSGNQNYMQSLLTDSTVTNLNNTGMPMGPTDITTAYQWDLMIPGGSSAAVITNITVVPEPATVLGVAAAGLGLAAWLRRRRRQRAAAV